MASHNFLCYNIHRNVDFFNKYKYKMTEEKQELKQVFEDLKDKIDPVIEEVLKSGIDEKFQPLALHQIQTGGKRLRPSLAILSCQMLGGKLEDILYPAAGLEILHNYTLIIDDIIDHSSFRRNQPTTWAKYGKSIAKCVAVDYSAAIFQTANHASDPSRVSEIFAVVLKKIIDGEITDILFERAGRDDEPFVVQNRYKTVSQDDYFKMISAKTASLFEAACELGGVCANVSQDSIQALKEYGFNLGLAFQIQDDILDIFGDQKKFGKPIGADIRERKGNGNIVLLYTAKELADSDQGIIDKVITEETITQEDIEKVISLINKTSARQKAEELGQSFIKKAKEALKSLPQNKENKLLFTLADFIIAREK